MTHTQQPEIGKLSRTMFLRNQLELSVRYLISDCLTDDDLRYSVIRSLAEVHNIPMEINENLHKTLDFFLKACKKHHVRFECCLSRKGEKDFVFYQLYFSKEQHLTIFFERMGWSIDTIEWPTYTIN